MRMLRDEDESLIIYLKKELEASLVRNDALEKENQEMRQEIVRLKAQVSLLKAHDNERKSMLWKKLQNSNDTLRTDVSQQKPSDFVKVLEQTAAKITSKQDTQIQELGAKKESAEKVPNPPPRPVSMSIPLSNGNKLTPRPAPPPPPLPSKIFGLKSIRRVPELVEFYRMLTKKDVPFENRSNNHAAVLIPAFTPDMIGEIESRSSYLSSIKSDVENHKGFINSLSKEVESAAFTDISNVEAFVKWLEIKLSLLVDERAVLKHFPQWPEQKVDALREATSNYRNLFNLKSEVSSFEDNLKEPLTQALSRIQALQDRLERSVNNVERTRESTTKRYKDFQIPWEWLLNTGLIGEIKLGSLKLARAFMRRITSELQLNECSSEDNILLQGAKFAYRIHQFAGGFDTETTNAFQELKKVAMCSNNQ